MKPNKDVIDIIIPVVVGIKLVKQFIKKDMLLAIEWNDYYCRKLKDLINLTFGVIP